MAGNLIRLDTRLRFHLKDVNNEFAERALIINQVIEEIALETRLFKKIYGFTVHKDKNLYDFRAIGKLNENTEIELQDVFIHDLTPEQIWEYVKTGEWQDPEIDKEEFVEENGISAPIGVMDIYDETGHSISHRFKWHGGSQYYCYDEAWLEENDGVTMAFVAYVNPDLDELRDEDIVTITPAIIEGCKYYFFNTFTTKTDDSGVANLYYTRYFQKKQNLIDMFPTQMSSMKGNRTWL